MANTAGPLVGSSNFNNIKKEINVYIYRNCIAIVAGIKTHNGNQADEYKYLYYKNVVTPPGTKRLARKFIHKYFCRINKECRKYRIDVTEYDKREIKSPEIEEGGPQSRNLFPSGRIWSDFLPNPPKSMRV